MSNMRKISPPPSPMSLTERHLGQTRDWILDSAVGLLEQSGMAELTVKTIAAATHISERTVFRHFGGRDDLLDALAIAVRKRLDLPPPPATLEEVVLYPYVLFPRFEAASALTQAALHSDLYPRMRALQSQDRGEAVARLLAQHAGAGDSKARELAAVSIRFLLTATAWNYYRHNFGLSAEDAMLAPSTLIRQAVAGLIAPVT